MWTSPWTWVTGPTGGDKESDLQINLNAYTLFKHDELKPHIYLQGFQKSQGVFKEIGKFVFLFKWLQKEKWNESGKKVDERGPQSVRRRRPVDNGDWLNRMEMRGGGRKAPVENKQVWTTESWKV